MTTPLANLIEALRHERRVNLDAHPLVEWQTLSALGLTVDGKSVIWPADCEPLDVEQISSGLDANAGLRQGQVEVLPVVGSTNDWLRERYDPSSNSEGWRAVSAECQLAGKGRLGRQWNTPVGGSIALSVAIPVRRSADQLGGLSLVVGLAVLEALDSNGALQLGLKWPNDIQAGKAKLGGILIELMGSSHGHADLIVGIGLNFRLPVQVEAAIDKQVTDLTRLGVTRNRSEILATLLRQLRTFVQEFERLGFPPFRSAFDAVHVFQNTQCTLLNAGEEVYGSVAGVDSGGRLLLETASGLKHFSAGEVSLREFSGAG